MHPTTLPWKITKISHLSSWKLNKIDIWNFLLLVYFNVFDCTFISFLSFCHEINSGAIYSIIMSLMMPD